MIYTLLTLSSLLNDHMGTNTGCVMFYTYTCVVLRGSKGYRIRPYRIIFLKITVSRSWIFCGTK